ncbi:HAD family hydrolase [Kutzneria sp. CA-103260]|uniref:HAD family hydrolase n=1 Tax=Kutzneria sp. CA-103260 TaxID=2802641 RepID=UPI001BAD2A5F|nr:HAD family hydrolase [Kutzneria sp. CA-103260]QUQ65058.1 HAD family hydrolase [Kutzneria sp. CA-103260]
MLALFDLDGTLADRAAGLRAWAVEFCADHGLDLAEADWLVEADGDGRVAKEEFFGRVRERYGLAESFEELFRQYSEWQPTLIPVYDGVLGGLERLRSAGWRLGVVTNGYQVVQTNTLVSTGIAERVDGWAISGAEDVWKPDVRLFEIAAARAGGKPGADGWMVGDSTADIVGGHAAGLRTIWLHHDRPWPAAEPAPTRTVSNPTEAIALILGLGIA